MKKEVTITTMVLSLIFPLETSDLLLLIRFYSLVTAVAMITGYPVIGMVCAAFGAYYIQDDDYHASSRNDGEILSNWLLLNSLSALVSLGSWLLMFLSTLQSNPHQAYRTYFFGYAIQKLWAIGLGYVLYQDLKLSLDLDRTKSISPPPAKPSTLAIGRPAAPTSRRELLLSRKSSLALVFYEIRIRVIKGQNLVPMDHAYKFFGKMTTSDPYVVLLLGPNHIGKTIYVPKTLDPVWPNRIFRTAVLPKSIEIYKHIECQIFDYDCSSSDDPMGTVYVPIPKEYNTKITKWYKVQKGKGEAYCEQATGELLVEIEVITE